MARHDGFEGIEWRQGTGGDSGRVVVDPTNPRIVFVSTNGTFHYRTTSGETWGEISTAGMTSIFMYAVGPNNGSIVYATSEANGYFFSPGPTLFAAPTVD